VHGGRGGARKGGGKGAWVSRVRCELTGVQRHGAPTVKADDRGGGGGGESELSVGES
jgi:hypothetical protein